MASPRTHALLLPLVVLSGCGGAAAAAPPGSAGAIAAASQPALKAAKVVEAVPVAERRGRIDGEPVRLEMFQPRRRGGTVVLDLRVSTEVEDERVLIGGAFDDGTTETTTDPDDPLKSDFDSMDGISLIDGVGRRRYLVARDRYGHCVCDRDMTNSVLIREAPLRLSAVFGAPPPTVETVDVVIPRFGTFADVPLG